MTISSGNFNELLEVGLNMIFMDEVYNKQDYIPTFFDVRSSEGAHEYALKVSGMGDVPIFAGSISYAQEPAQGTKQTFSHVEYAKGLRIERKLIDDNRYPDIMNKMRSFAQSVFRTRQKKAADIFNYAFSSTDSGGNAFVGADGFPLCYSAHTAIGRGASQGNAGSTAFSKTALSATRLLMMKFDDEDGEMMNILPNTVVAPIDLEESIYEVIKSDLKPDTANNNINFSNDRYNAMIYPWLTDTNNWFLIDLPVFKSQVIWWNRIMPEFQQVQDFDSYDRKYAVYMRFSYGFTDWKGVYGHQVT